MSRSSSLFKRLYISGAVAKVTRNTITMLACSWNIHKLRNSAIVPYEKPIKSVFNALFSAFSMLRILSSTIFNSLFSFLIVCFYLYSFCKKIVFFP